MRLELPASRVMVTLSSPLRTEVPRPPPKEVFAAAAVLALLDPLDWSTLASSHATDSVESRDAVKGLATGTRLAVLGELPSLLGGLLMVLAGFLSKSGDCGVVLSSMHFRH